MNSRYKFFIWHKTNRIWEQVPIEAYTQANRLGNLTRYEITRY